MTIPPDQDIPDLLCGHSRAGAHRASFRVVCGECASFWDTDSLATEVEYDETYPAKRGHFNPLVSELKIRTLARWLRVAGVDITGKSVCEVGFGGGACLPLLASRARTLIGVEANASVIERARATGINAEFLLADSLPPRLDTPVDLWVFQDSFEHLPDPASFADWMRDNSSNAAQILLVAPRADSASRRALGRFWPHKLPDHQFHWSRSGLVEFMARRGFQVRRDFFPLKFASSQMIVAHFRHKLGARGEPGRWIDKLSFAIPINFGELGIVFERRPG